MKYRLLLVFGITTAISMQGICGSVTYKLTESGDPHVCGIFLAALKASRLAKLSDKQLCVVQNSPVTDLLSNPHIRAFQWLHYPVQSKVEKRKLAERIALATLSLKGVPILSVRGITDYMLDFDAANASTDIVVQQAELHFGYKTFYPLRMKRKVCDATYRTFGGVPAWGIFKDKGHTEGVAFSVGGPDGNLFYLDGYLMTLSILPWNTGSNISKVKNNRFVYISHLVYYPPTPTVKQQFKLEDACAVNIHKQN